MKEFERILIRCWKDDGFWEGVGDFWANWAKDLGIILILKDVARILDSVVGFERILKGFLKGVAEFWILV